MVALIEYVTPAYRSMSISDLNGVLREGVAGTTIDQFVFRKMSTMIETSATNTSFASAEIGFANCDVSV